MKQKVCVLGAGAWGTAVAQLLAENGQSVCLWCFETDVATEISKKNCNDKYLPGITLNRNIIAVDSIEQAFEGAAWIFEAVPTQFLRSVLQKCKSFYKPEQQWVVLSKGIENNTLMFPGQIIDDVFQAQVKKCVLGGPSFAKNLAAKQITAVTIASESKENAKHLQAMLNNDYFCSTITGDVLGVQLGGALKNILALIIGMLDGAGFADNTKAFVFTRGLQEMVLLSHKLGAKKQTIYGLSGLGDLVLTAMGSLSKNLDIGKRLGSGTSIDKILQEKNSVPEGINTIESIYHLCKKENITLPLLCGVYDVVFGKKTIIQFLQNLMCTR